MWGIVNIKTNACLCMLQRTVRKSAKEILALKDTEKYASMEKVLNINLKVNKKGHEVVVNEISGLKKAFNDLLENKL